MVWWIVAALAAFFVKGLCGFANTLVFSTILSFGTNNINISPVDLLLGYPTNVILAWKERKSIKWGVCLPLIALVIGGSIPGIFFLKNSDVTIVKIFFGFVIVIIGLEMLLREIFPGSGKQNKVVLAIIGILAGLMCGLYGIGALLGAYVGRVTKDSHEFKANMCMVFCAENLFRIILYSAWGILNAQAWKNALMLAPVMLAGLWLGMAGGRILNEKVVKKIVIITLIISGLALVINNLI